MERIDKTVRTFFGNTHNDFYYNIEEDKYYNNPEVAFYDSTVVVERAGYKPVRLQVLDFLNAGERLLANRREVHYQSEIDKLENNDLPLPVTRLKTDFDLNDAYRLSKQYNEKLKDLNKAIENRKEQQRLENESLFKEFSEWKKAKEVSKPGVSSESGNPAT